MPNPQNVTKEDIEAINKQLEEMRRDMEELKKLLKAAIEYNKKVGEPHCENDEKIALIKQVADALGVDLTDVFGDE